MPANYDDVEREAPTPEEAAAYSAPFTTDVPQCCGDPATCNDPCSPTGQSATAETRARLADMLLSFLEDDSRRDEYVRLTEDEAKQIIAALTDK